MAVGRALAKSRVGNRYAGDEKMDDACTTVSAVEAEDPLELSSVLDSAEVASMLSAVATVAGDLSRRRRVRA